MKKNILLVGLIILVFTINLSLVNAENKRRYSYVDNNEKYYFDIDKNNDCVDLIVASESTLYKKCTINSHNIQSAGKKALFEKDVDGAVFFYPRKGDKVFTGDNIWWGSVYVCKMVNTTGFLDPGGTTSDVRIYTDALQAGVDEFTFMNVINGGTDSKCYSFTLESVAGDQFTYSCEKYQEFSGEIMQLIEKYKVDNNTVYRQKYKRVLEQIEDSCRQILKSADYSDGCVQSCLNYHIDKVSWDDVFYPNSSGSSGCGLSQRVVGLIQNYLLKGIRYVVPALVILLGIIDFLRALATDKEDGMKKAQGRFVKRLIAAALIFLVPYILEFIIEKMEFVPEGCGIINM